MLVDVNTCFGKSPQRRIAYAEGVRAAGMFDDPSAAGPTRQDVDWSLDNLLRILDQHGVGRALTYSLRGKLYDMVAGNDETWQTARQHAQLVPVATLDPRRPVGCAAEAGRCLDMGFRAFRFFPDAQGWNISALPFRRLMDALAGRDVIVMLPAGGWGHQTALAGLLCPLGLTVMAMGAPFPVLAESIAVAAAYERFLCETSGMITADAVETLAAEAGADRLVFGSNSPEWSFEAGLNIVNAARLSDADRSAILGGNALRCLGLEGSP